MITPEGSRICFKKYYAIVQTDTYGGWTFSAKYEADGYNPFFIYYENGRLAARGYCRVSSQPQYKQIVHEMEDVKNATYYTPDGEIASTVVEGTGVMMLFFPDGTKQWELELENYQRKSLKTWLKDGTLKLNKTY